MGEPTGPIIVICALDTDGKIRTLEVTASDELKVALATATGSDLLTELEAKLETADLEIVSNIPSVGDHGWIDSAWQRNALLFGYSAQIYKSIQSTTLPAGTSNVDGTAVPADEIWVMTRISAMCVSGSINNLQASVIIGGQTMNLFHKLPPVSTLWYSESAYLIMKEGDYLRVRVGAATLNDDVYLRGAGFRLDLDK